MNVIYIDTLFLINTSANCLLLLCAAKICDVRVSLFRIFFASAFGGAYALIASVTSYAFLTSLYAKLLFAVFMIFTAFGCRKKFIRLCAVFLTVSAALGGIVYAVSLGLDGNFSHLEPKPLMLSFLCAAALILSLFRRTGKALQETHKIEVSFFGKTEEFTAFTDTGNSLKDPLSGEPVIITYVKDIRKIFPRDLYRSVSSLQPADVMASLSGTAYSSYFRLLPYSAVGVKDGILLAMRTDIKIDGKPSPKTLLALSPTPVSDGGVYSALMSV